MKTKRQYLFLVLFVSLLFITGCWRFLPTNECVCEPCEVCEECEACEVCAVCEVCEECPTTEEESQEILTDTAEPQEPVKITGYFSYSNEFYPEGYAEEHAVGLFDMTGFILRDDEFVVSVESQVLGYCDLREDYNNATYEINLPARPSGQFNDLDNDDTEDIGIQVFAIEYAPNWMGGPFYVDDDEYWGWPTYLASVTTDSENDEEVTGGKLIIWSPDANQQVSSGFGDDGLLFTEDDPVMDVPAGYSVIDLDTDPFTVIREPEPEIVLLEPDDAAIKDFSDQSYTEAFNNMFDIVSKEYAFNGIEGKAPNWDDLYDAVYPKVLEAEQSRDGYAFYLAMREFSQAFSDGHVGLDGGDLEGFWVQENIYGGYGFAIRELDDGRAIVVYILEDGPADQAGIVVGAEIVTLRGMPVSDAIAETEPYSPQSTDFGLRYEQTVFVTRDGLYGKMDVGFKNPGQALRTVELESIAELDSLFATYLGGEYDEWVLPVEYDVLEEQELIGYVRVNSNSDDLNLSYRLYERALADFQDAGVNAIIIDMRLNFGGTPLGLATYLTKEDIPMGQLEYYNENTGQFEPDGDPRVYEPASKFYRFRDIILLVDQFCYSACELDSYALSQVPGITIIGEYPTAGVEAETARGNFDLPEGISFGVPTGRFVLEDGSVLLEGVGVVPDINLPVTFESVLSLEDVVLQRAIQEILGN